MSRSMHSPVDLMEPNLADTSRWGAGAASWAYQLYEKRAFRVRGFTNFRRLANFNASQLGGFISDMERTRRNLPAWGVAPFVWEENFAPAQINAAMKMSLLRFDKAAKVVLTCVVAARSKGVDETEVLESLRIEPATFGLVSFDAAYVAGMHSKGVRLIDELSVACVQPRGVFEAMSRRQSVTYRLARAVEKFCQDKAFDPMPGAIVPAWGQPWRESCSDEMISGLSNPDPGISITDMFNGLAA